VSTDADLTGGLFAMMLAYQKMMNRDHRDDLHLSRLNYELRFNALKQLTTVTVKPAPPCYECTF
jgi:hypothetical protein